MRGDYGGRRDGNNGGRCEREKGALRRPGLRQQWLGDIGYSEDFGYGRN